MSFTHGTLTGMSSRATQPNLHPYKAPYKIMDGQVSLLESPFDNNQTKG